MPIIEGRADEEVQLDLLSKRIGRFALTAAVSKRSRDLKERIDSVLTPSSGALVRRSLREIAEQKVKILPSEEDKDEGEEGKK